MKKERSNKKFEDPKVQLVGLIYCVIGAFLAYVPFIWSMNEIASWIVFTVGIALAMFGLAQIALGMYWTDLARKQLERRLKHANEGVIWIWAVCLASIVLYAIAYYSLVYPTLELIGIVEGMFTFDPQATVTLNLCKAVLNWHPIIFILGMLLWGFVNSARRETQTYPL